MTAPLNFDRLRKQNVSRCEDVFHAIDDWSPTDWACAMAGEAGETCNAVKKLRRLDDDQRRNLTSATAQVLVAEIAKELADTIIYADLLAARLGIDLGEAVRAKFNEVSDKRKSGVKL